jgi:hypothetical protein
MNGRFRYMKIVSLLLLATAQSLWAQPSEKIIADSRNNCLNFIHINGESNVNQFSFDFNQTPLIGNRLTMTSDTGDVIIRIPIRDFQASNPMMYKDFLEMMKASEFPRIEICFSRNQLNKVHSGNYGSCPEIRITIAGISRKYAIDCSVFPCANNMFIQGEKKIKLTDFQLKPPVKLAGLVKVSDEVNVDFGFMITFADTNPLSSTL